MNKYTLFWSPPLQMWIIVLKDFLLLKLFPLSAWSYILLLILFKINIWILWIKIYLKVLIDFINSSSSGRIICRPGWPFKTKSNQGWENSHQEFKEKRTASEVKGQIPELYNLGNWRPILSSDFWGYLYCI